MRLATTSLATASLASLAIALPTLEKRADELPPVVSETDASVLKLALFLEHLETALYSGGHDNFSEEQYTAAGFPAGFRSNVGVIAQHEVTHADTISAILTKAGMKPFPACTYKFPYDSPTSFVALANMVTSVGIGAYLGAAASLMDDPSLLTGASSILTVEARHDSFLRHGIDLSPFPTAFDTSLPAIFAYNIAYMLVDTCPPEANLPLTLLPKLKLESPNPMPPKVLPKDPKAPMAPLAVGTPLKFSYDPSTFFVAVDKSKPLYIALINSATNVTYTEVSDCGSGCAQIPLPDKVKGIAFAVLTTFSDQAALSEEQLYKFGTLAGPAEVFIS